MFISRAAVGKGMEVSERWRRENAEWEPLSTRGREDISRQDESSISTDRGRGSDSLGHWSIIPLLRKLKKRFKNIPQRLKQQV